MQCIDKYSHHSSIISPVWLNGSVFLYEVNDCDIESPYCHLNFRYGISFEHGVHLHSGRL